MIIKVTAEHIAKGAQNQCDSCPVALALLSVLKPGYSVDVDLESAGIWGLGDLVHSFVLPDVASNFIETFDSEIRDDGRTSDLLPFEFQLPIAEEHLR